MRVLIVSPHPDDAEVFAGGSARLHVLRADSVETAVLTRGEHGTLRAILRRGPNEPLARRRVEEARRAGRRLGCAETHQFDLGDGHLSEEGAAARLRALAEDLRPELVYGPEPERSFYHHPDHLAAGRAVLRLFQGRVPLRFYHTRRPDHFVDISAVWGEKRAALNEHRSQRPLLELARLYTYMNPAWRALHTKSERFRTVAARAGVQDSKNAGSLNPRTWNPNPFGLC